MKKILLFALPILALCFASCEKDNGGDEVELSGDDIIQFEDAHFLQALLTVQEIEMYDADRDDWIDYLVDVDRNKDGQISVNEAQNVRGLELYNYEANESFNVLSMPEIKYFTSLEYLDCSYNQLTTLDVSKNTALTYLDCEGNQLTSLDVSRCTALTDLYCEYNDLTSLDVSKNPVLKCLYSQDNKFTSLDVSKNTALTELGFSNNYLTSIDISNNTSLTKFYCINNQLTFLDVSNNPLTGECWFQDNPLKSLKISSAQQDRYWMNDIKEEYPDIEIIVK